MATLKDNSGNTAGVSKFGGTSSVRQRTASKFVPNANWVASSITVSIKRDTGTPSGDVQIGIFTDSSGVPSSTQVGGYATVTQAETTASYAPYTKSFSSTATLASGSTYWIVLRVASGENDSNYYSSQQTSGSAGNGAQYNEPTPVTWTNNTDDLNYILTGTITASSASRAIFI